MDTEAEEPRVTTTSTIRTNHVPNPRVGMLAIVRKRRGVISDVREFDGERGRLHLVRVDYSDDHRPVAEELIWELEPLRLVLEPCELPSSSGPPMPGDDFDAIIRAARWTAISPYIDPDADGPIERLPVSSPFHGAVEVDDYQLVAAVEGTADAQGESSDR